MKRGLKRAAVATAFCLLTVFLPASEPSAHELRPSVATLVVDENPLTLTMNVNLEALMARIGPEHSNTQTSPNAERYERLRRMRPDALRRVFRDFEAELLSGVELKADGEPTVLTVKDAAIPPIGDPELPRITHLVLSAPVVVPPREVAWRFHEAFGASVFRLVKSGEEAPFSALYRAAGAVEVTVPLDRTPDRSWGEIALDYAVIGFEHILPKGLDHILFVVGLFLMNARWRPLLLQITCFTVAHSLTLGLALNGLVSAAPSIVEPLIAASIVYVAAENLMTQRVRSWRLAVVFAFGLVHGLGFAGVLGEIGLPEGQFVTALTFFNIGVELGQLTVLAACYAAVGVWFSDRTWYRQRVTNPASIGIAILAAFWVVERLA